MLRRPCRLARLFYPDELHSSFISPFTPSRPTSYLYPLKEILEATSLTSVLTVLTLLLHSTWLSRVGCGHSQPQPL